MTELIVVETTVESRQDAEKIASELVEKRLAACVQIIGPITSIYRWKGQIEKATESAEKSNQLPLRRVLEELQAEQREETDALTRLDAAPQ